MLSNAYIQEDKMKRNFKRMTALLLTLIMALSLCACGSSSDNAGKNGASSTAAEEIGRAHV